MESFMKLCYQIAGHQQINYVKRGAIATNENGKVLL